VTPSGTEPAIFRLLAQCLNQLRHRVPRKVLKNFASNPALQKESHERIQEMLESLKIRVVSDNKHF
jgi:hypothetical protein